MVFVTEVTEWIQRDLVADEGFEISRHTSKTLDECKLLCDDTDGCNSIAWKAQGVLQSNCYLKEKCLTKDEQSSFIAWGFKSYYKPCMVSSKILVIHVTE